MAKNKMNYIFKNYKGRNYLWDIVWGPWESGSCEYVYKCRKLVSDKKLVGSYTNSQNKEYAKTTAKKAGQLP